MLLLLQLELIGTACTNLPWRSRRLQRRGSGFPVGLEVKVSRQNHRTIRLWGIAGKKRTRVSNRTTFD
jgi:hypothetical protein